MAIKKRRVVNAKKTIVDGITFQSGLEAKMYTLLKKAKITFVYEGAKFTVLESMTYSEECWEKKFKKDKVLKDSRNIRKIEYTPDFTNTSDVDKVEWVIETKGRPNESFPLRWKMFKGLVNEMSRPPIIFMPTTVAECEQVIEILKSKGY